MIIAVSCKNSVYCCGCFCVVLVIYICVGVDGIVAHTCCDSVTSKPSLYIVIGSTFCCDVVIFFITVKCQFSICFSINRCIYIVITYKDYSAIVSWVCGVGLPYTYVGFLVIMIDAFFICI